MVPGWVSKKQSKPKLIRYAMGGDSKTIWLWRNDPIAITNSFDQKEIKWREHVEWYKTTLHDDTKKILIGVCEKTEELMGMVRFDIDFAKMSSEVSINLSPRWRGKHISYSLLSRAIEEFESAETWNLIAKIKPHNIASLQCFEHCGFTLEDKTGDCLNLVRKAKNIDEI